MATAALPESLPLGQLRARAQGVVASVDWAALSADEARRLREFGLDEGVAVELLHPPALGGGPLACRIGRMSVVMRRRVAEAISVTPVSITPH